MFIFLVFVIMAVVAQAAGTVQQFCFELAGSRMSVTLREAWFRAVLRQDVAWFDANNPGELPTIITSASLKYQDACSKKLGEGLQFLTTGVAGAAMAWRTHIGIRCTAWQAERSPSHTAGRSH